MEPSRPNRVAFVLSMGFTACLLGCASTRITSQADITARGNTYDTLMVVADFSDLDFRKLGEHEITTKLVSHGVTCLASSDLFFPGKTYSAEDMAAKLIEEHIKGILVIAGSAAGTTESYVPPTYYTQGTAWVSGNQVNGRSTTQTIGGYTQRKPWAKFRGELIDLHSEQSTWVATANSGGDAFASQQTLLRSFCGRVVNQLIADGVVGAR